MQETYDSNFAKKTTKFRLNQPKNNSLGLYANFELNLQNINDKLKLSNYSIEIDIL